MRIGKRIVIAAVGLALTLGGGFLLIFHVPRYKKTWDDYGEKIPAGLEALLQVSDFVAQYWFMLLPGLFLTAAAFVVLPMFLDRTGSRSGTAK